MSARNQPRPQQKTVREVGLEGTAPSGPQPIPTRPLWQARRFARRPALASPLYTFVVEGCIGEYTGRISQLSSFRPTDGSTLSCTCRECFSLARSAWFVALAPGCHCKDCQYAQGVAEHFAKLHRSFGYVPDWHVVDLAPLPQHCH